MPMMRVGLPKGSNNEKSGKVLLLKVSFQWEWTDVPRIDKIDNVVNGIGSPNSCLNDLNYGLPELSVWTDSLYHRFYGFLKSPWKEGIVALSSRSSFGLIGVNLVCCCQT